MSGGGNEVEDTKQQRDLAYVAAQGWNFSQEELAPLQDKYVEMVNSMDDPARKDFVSGKANLGTQDVTGDAYEQSSASLNARGLDLNSGQAKGTLTDVAIASAESGGNVAANGLFEQDTQHIKGLQTVVDMGNGDSAQAVAGLSDVATVAGQNARSDAMTSFNRRSANLQTVGTLAGAGTRYAMQSATPGINTQGQAKPLYDNTAYVKRM